MNFNLQLVEVPLGLLGEPIDRETPNALLLLLRALGVESGQRVPGANDLAAIQKALEAAGVEFTNGANPGVMITADR